MTPQAEGIRFEVERLAATSPGRVEVSGRWYGIRGRRFVRPTLTFILAAGGAEQRMLADLEHKPWATQDGEFWQAAFPLDGKLDGADRIELNVAPDITVELTPHDGGDHPAHMPARHAPVSAAAHARSPVVRDNPARPRPRAPRSPEVERLHERLALAEAVITKERARREAADKGLEDERRSARTLQAEVGRVRAELELARTVQRELETASDELDTLRRHGRESGRERDQIVSERDEAQRELAAEQAAAEHVRSQLADAEAAVRRLTQARTGVLETSEDRPEPGGGIFDRAPPVPRSERPVNPSLRASNWIGRGIALVVIIAVIVAVIVVINSTIR